MSPMEFLLVATFLPGISAVQAADAIVERTEESRLQVLARRSHSPDMHNFDPAMFWKDSD